MNAPPCIVYVWRGEGTAPARTGQGLVIASEAIARSFGVFSPLLDEFDDAFIALPCPAEEDDVKRMVDLIVALRASSGVECPICYEALRDNPMRTGFTSLRAFPATSTSLRALPATPWRERARRPRARSPTPRRRESTACRPDRADQRNAPRAVTAARRGPAEQASRVCVSARLADSRRCGLCRAGAGGGARGSRRRSLAPCPGGVCTRRPRARCGRPARVHRAPRAGG